MKRKIQKRARGAQAMTDNLQMPFIVCDVSFEGEDKLPHYCTKEKGHAGAHYCCMCCMREKKG